MRLDSRLRGNDGLADMLNLIGQFQYAIQFLTILPMGKRKFVDGKDLARSMIFYPAVGGFIGFISLEIFRFSQGLFPPSVCLVIAFLTGIVLTGGLHLDGFADTCDGFYAGQNKEEILNIMRDPHVGTMAVLGIVCTLALKLSLFFTLLLKQRIDSAFLLAPAVSRWAMAMGAGFFPYARAEGGTAGPFIKNMGPFEMAGSSLIAVALTGAIGGFSGVLTAFTALAFGMLFLFWIHRRIGGITGDNLGALNELSEIAVLFLMCLFPQRGFALNAWR